MDAYFVGMCISGWGRGEVTFGEGYTFRHFRGWLGVRGMGISREVGCFVGGGC